MEVFFRAMRLPPSPEGATVNSQGRKPLVRRSNDRRKPPRGDRNTEIGDSVAPSGLMRLFSIMSQGLTPLAIDYRPFGAGGSSAGGRPNDLGEDCYGHTTAK